VPLVEDLARRDLVVNAIAYDPAKHELIDPFGGQDDIAHRRLRAVGNAVERFTEDGLRVMRAVRFAAQLEFELAPDTEAGIRAALPSLEKVSRERVCDELRKMLVTREPSRGLAIARRTRILGSILPTLDAAIREERAWLAVIDRAKTDVRLAALLAPLHSHDAPATIADAEVAKQVLLILRDLKFSNVESELAAQLVSVAHCVVHGSRDHAVLDDDVQLRRLLARVDRDKRERVVWFWQALAPDDEVVTRAVRVLAANPPLGVGELAVKGKDLMTALGMKPGPALGRILAQLLDQVLVDPARNTREGLIAAARQLELALAHDDE
jgi:tRNA nucleotidyltransferase (CCA-adding enzyme)